MLSQCYHSKHKKGYPLKEDELNEESVKPKSAPQFNARISEELKQTIDDLGSITGKSKPELLDELVRVYQTKRASDEFADIDLTRYDNLSNPLKESVHNAFTHILNAVNGNLSTLKQEGIHIEKEKLGLLEREEAYRVEIESIKSTSAKDILSLGEEKEQSELELNTQIEFWKNRSSELETKNIELHKEFDNVNKIAEQVQVVILENKDLRESSRTTEASHKLVENDLTDQIKSLSDGLTEAKESIFKVGLESDSKDKEIEALKVMLVDEKNERTHEVSMLKEDLLSATHKLSNTQNEYSKALGKLEILEKE